MNIYDVAKEAGVSPSTVSRVLNNKSNVKSSTREKVMRVIEGTSYKPNALARELSVGKSRNIAFLGRILRILFQQNSAWHFRLCD